MHFQILRKAMSIRTSIKPKTIFERKTIRWFSQSATFLNNEKCTILTVRTNYKKKLLTMSKHTRMRNYRKMKSVSKKEQSERPKDTRLRTCRIIRSYLGQIAILFFFRQILGWRLPYVDDPKKITERVWRKYIIEKRRYRTCPRCLICCNIITCPRCNAVHLVASALSMMADLDMDRR